jgi:hypothetical protein
LLRYDWHIDVESLFGLRFAGVFVRKALACLICVNVPSGRLSYRADTITTSLEDLNVHASRNQRCLFGRLSGGSPPRCDGG